MRQLLPEPGDVDPVDCYAVPRTPPPDRPWVLVSMVTSVDGATAIEGVSGGLGGPADKQVFSAIRGVADVVLAGAGTVRAERYGPPRTPPSIQAARRQRGQAAKPRIAVLSRSLDLPLDSALFTTPADRPIVMTCAAADPDRRAAVAAVADVVEAGASDVDLALALAALREAGVGVVVGEGGPGTNGQLVAAGLVDELCVTLSPRLVGGGSSRLAVGPDAARTDLRLVHLLEEDGLLFLRYVRT
jgi:riboflavin biosynthesis pyrimidine reductase